MILARGKMLRAFFCVQIVRRIWRFLMARSFDLRTKILRVADRIIYVKEEKHNQKSRVQAGKPTLD